MSDIDSESFNALVSPEFEGFEEIVPDFLVIPVEIGLRSIEEMEIPLTVSHWFPG
jgi:hypothetical protein